MCRKKKLELLGKKIANDEHPQVEEKCMKVDV
jgi:hypothetical protein